MVCHYKTPRCPSQVAAKILKLPCLIQKTLTTDRSSTKQEAEIIAVANMKILSTFTEETGGVKQKLTNCHYEPEIRAKIGK